VESSTKGNSIEAKTESLDLTCRPHPTTNIVKYSTDADTPSATYDAWFTSVYSAVTAAPALTVISLAGATSGKTKITVGPALTGADTYVYKTSASVALPAAGDTLSTGWTAWDGSAEITATTGHVIVMAEINASNACVKAGSATVVSKS
jgi:hypothetical protein